MRQPNFKELFFQTFTEQQTAVKYRVRTDSNLPHDVQFLNSLVHESRFQIKEIVTDKQTVEIPLKRSCWERYEEVNKQNIVETPSLLRFRNVNSFRWVMGETLYMPPLKGHLVDADESISETTEYEITTIYIGETTYMARSGDLEIVLSGYPRHWQFRITLSREKGSITLADISQPNV